MSLDLAALAASLREGAGLRAKGDITHAARALGLSGGSVVPVGDDCAAIPQDDGYLLFAIEGFINVFVERDPWFAGWCGVMVNLSDVAAMGGRPIAVVDALWACGNEAARPVLEGMRAASERFGVPVVGGHANFSSERSQLAVAVLGRAARLMTSFDAEPGDRLIAAIDLRGRYREPFDNWEAATDAPAERLRGDLALLPQLAEAGLCRAAKDISQAGLVGTSAMLAECSGVGVAIDLEAAPRPEGVALERWLKSFPSFGYLLSVKPRDVDAVVARFAARSIAAADIGAITCGPLVEVLSGGARETIWDFSSRPLIGCGPERALA